MAHIRKILVPCDGSPPSIAALTEALALASDLGASVDLLAVRAPEAGLAPAASASKSEASMLEEAFVAAQLTLGDRIGLLEESGEPARAILETAARGYDLIVMGTHGRIGRLHARLGSVAETVVRSASMPVLTVRSATGEEESFAERIHRVKSIADQVRR